ncbi:MAG: sulfatase [Proteobacteria bacterium]|nr:sulfatase [Pseudomonadota bacterium]
MIDRIHLGQLNANSIRIEFLLPALSAALVITMLIAGSCGSKKKKPRPGKPNLVLVTLDTTRQDRLGIYGSNNGLSTNLDRVGSEGVLFTGARTQVPITLPSHVSLLTGQGVLEHGIRENGTFTLPDSVTTLAEHLSQSGYLTAAFVSSFVLDHRFGLAQGFDTYDDEMTLDKKKRWQGHRDVGEFERPAAETTSRAREWLEENLDSDRPFFLWVHYFDPHYPWEAPKKYERKSAAPEVVPSEYSTKVVYKGMTAHGAGIVYNAEVEYMDFHFGRLMEILDRPQTKQRTLLIVASDHGENLGERDEVYGHGQDLFEPAMRTVLMMRKPGLIPTGKVVGDHVPMTDIPSTALDLLGIPQATFPGKSLRPVWEQNDTSRQDAPFYMETLLGALRKRAPGMYGLRVGPWKLVYIPDEKKKELYNLENDPLAMTDLSQKENDRVSRMVVRLEDILKKGRVNLRQQPLEVDEATAKKLKALGYF